MTVIVKPSTPVRDQPDFALEEVVLWLARPVSDGVGGADLLRGAARGGDLGDPGRDIGGRPSGRTVDRASPRGLPGERCSCRWVLPAALRPVLTGGHCPRAPSPLAAVQSQDQPPELGPRNQFTGSTRLTNV